MSCLGRLSEVCLDVSISKDPCKDPDPIPGREDPLVKEMQPTPVVLPGESHGQRRLQAIWPWGHKSWTRLSD